MTEITIAGFPNPENADLATYNMLNCPAESIRNGRKRRNFSLSKLLEHERPTVWAVAIYGATDSKKDKPSQVQLLAFNDQVFSYCLTKSKAPFAFEFKGGFKHEHLAEFVTKAISTKATTILLRPPLALPHKPISITDYSESPSSKKFADILTKASREPGKEPGPFVIALPMCNAVPFSPAAAIYRHYVQSAWHNPGKGEEGPIQWPLGDAVLEAVRREPDRIGLIRSTN